MSVLFLMGERALVEGAVFSTVSSARLELTRGEQGYRPADLTRLGGIGVDLTVTLVAYCLEAESALPAQTYRRALLVRCGRLR